MMKNKRILQHTLFKIILKWQQIFYVALLLPVGVFSQDSVEFSSDILSAPDKQDGIRNYYPKDLENLRNAVIPRTIWFFSTDNYRTYGKVAVRGILFTFRDPRAGKVELITDTDNFHPRMMRRNMKGVWYLLLPDLTYLNKEPNGKLLYKFKADGRGFHLKPDEIKISGNRAIVQGESEKKEWNLYKLKIAAEYATALCTGQKIKQLDIIEISRENLFK